MCRLPITTLIELVPMWVAAGKGEVLIQLTMARFNWPSPWNTMPYSGLRPKVQDRGTAANGLAKRRFNESAMVFHGTGSLLRGRSSMGKRNTQQNQPKSEMQTMNTE